MKFQVGDFIKHEKGYGFIKEIHNEKVLMDDDTFVHKTDIIKVYAMTRHGSKVGYFIDS